MNTHHILYLKKSMPAFIIMLLGFLNVLNIQAKDTEIENHETYKRYQRLVRSTKDSVVSSWKDLPIAQPETVIALDYYQELKIFKVMKYVEQLVDACDLPISYINYQKENINILRNLATECCLNLKDNRELLKKAIKKQQILYEKYPMESAVLGNYVLDVRWIRDQIAKENKSTQRILCKTYVGGMPASFRLLLIDYMIAYLQSQRWPAFIFPKDITETELKSILEENKWHHIITSADVLKTLNVSKYKLPDKLEKLVSDTIKCTQQFAATHDASSTVIISVPLAKMMSQAMVYPQEIEMLVKADRTLDEILMAYGLWNYKPFLEDEIIDKMGTRQQHSSLQYALFQMTKILLSIRKLEEKKQ